MAREQLSKVMDQLLFSLSSKFFCFVIHEEVHTVFVGIKIFLRFLILLITDSSTYSSVIAEDIDRPICFSLV